jgi:fructose-bisphosphate aldolase class II
MNTLSEYLVQARLSGKAIPHFNVSTIDMIHAVFDAVDSVSDECGQKIPLVIGLAEKERDFIGESIAVSIVHELAKIHDHPIFINADHTYNIERAKAAIDAGYDSVVIDFADKSYEENVTMTLQVVEYRNSIGSKCLIEAELGYIGAGSQLRDSIPAGVSIATMTDPDQAARFIADTGADMLAPSIGNIHGIVRGGNPALDADRVSAIAERLLNTPLVLHGGSGSTDSDFKSVITAGVSLIHISTELRAVYRDALVKSLAETTDLAPYKYLQSSYDAVVEVVKNRTKLFWGI